MPSSAAVPPAHALPQWVVSYPNGWFPTPMRLAAPGGGAMPTRRGAFSLRYLDFRSDTTLCKRYHTCEVTVSL